jgi:hypothetical protein
MLRRPSDASRRPRFPRPAWRSGSAAAEGAEVPEKAPEFEFASKLEAAVLGLLAFFGGAALILARFVWSPRRFDRHADERGRLSSAVPPYTFLTLATFIATTAFRALLATLMLISLSITRSCANETEDPPDLPHLAEVFRLPSLEEVLGRGLASVLLIIGVLSLLRWFVSRRASSEVADRFFTLGLYVAGFQSLLATCALGLVVMSGLQLASRRIVDIPYTDVAGAVLLGLAILWPASLYEGQMARSLPPAQRSSLGRRSARWLAMGLAGLLTSVCTFLPGLLVAWILAVEELARQAQPRPLMQVAALADEAVPGAVPTRRVTLLVTDSTTRALHVLPGGAMLQRGVDERDYPLSARIVSWQGADRNVLTIEPGRSAWVVLEFVACPEPGRADCGLKLPHAPTSPEDVTPDWLRAWGFVDLHAPIPERANGRVGLMEVSAAGERKQVYAYVLGPLAR